MVKEIKNKILFVVTLAEAGGAQKYLKDLIEATNKDGYEVTIAAGGEDSSLLAWAKEKKVEVLPLPHLTRNLLWGILPNPGDFRTFLILASHIKEGGYNVVHFNSSKIGFIGSLAARFSFLISKETKRPRVVFTAHGWVFNEPASIRPRRWLWIAISKIAAYFQDQIICVSDYDFEQAIKYHIAPPRKLVTIYNGIDRKKVKFASRQRARKWLKETANIGENVPVLGTIANFYPTKDLGTMMGSLNHLPQEVVLVIIGREGSLSKENLIDLARSMEVDSRVFLLGGVDDAWQWIRSFDAYLISSLKEGLPFSALEAMASGVPIVSTRSGGLSNALFENPEKPSALSFAAGDSYELSQQITKILGNKAKASEITKNAQEAVKKRFSLEETIKKTKWVWSLC